MSTESTHTELVERVVERLLDGDNQCLDTLRTQYAAAEWSIDVTESGLFVEFELPAGVDTISERQNFHFGDVEAVVDELTYGIGFVLYVEEGRLSRLEGDTYEESLPDQVSNLTIHYTDTPRDLDELLRCQ